MGIEVGGLLGLIHLIVAIWAIIRPLAKVVIFAYKVKNELPNPENSIPLGVQTRSRNPPATLSRTA